MDKELISNVDLKQFFLDLQTKQCKNKIGNKLHDSIFHLEKYTSILEDINQLFIKNFQMNLSKFVGLDIINYNCSAIYNISYSELLNNNNIPIKINIMKLMSDEKVVFVGISSELIYSIIDLLFGGTGILSSYFIAKNHFTCYEQSIIKRLYTIISESYCSAWKTMFSVDIPRIIHEDICINDNIIGCSKKTNLFYSEFNTNMNSTSIMFSICIASNLMEEWNKNLWKKNTLLFKKNNKINCNHFNVLKNLELNVQVKLTDFQIPLSNIIKLKVGDILTIKKPNSIVAYVNGVPLLSGKYGSCDGKHAFSICNINNINLKE
ncbi:Flagellar motor switch protein FliM [Buchnera aphidicola (Eriosoma lanigerum)]|uniref:FliM/FliN family flagellar motor switch protein n=1 Tax=Buchnera aphidicola TaxID=9 RepID=UPI003464DB38